MVSSEEENGNSLSEHHVEDDIHVDQERDEVGGLDPAKMNDFDITHEYLQAWHHLTVMLHMKRLRKGKVRKQMFLMSTKRIISALFKGIFRLVMIWPVILWMILLRN